MLFGKKKTLTKDNRKLVPSATVLLSPFLFLVSASLVALSIREAFLTAGNIRPELVWIMLLAFVLTMVGMITGAVTMRRRDAQPFFPVMGIFVNFLLFAGILAIYALGF